MGQSTLVKIILSDSFVDLQFATCSSGKQIICIQSLKEMSEKLLR